MVTPGPGAAAPTRRSTALDGLRGFAAVAVVSSHLTAHLGLVPHATGGGIGVLVFFVLSGYLVTGQCWDRGRTPAAWASFVRRRVVRLGPAVLGLVLVGGPVLVAWGGETLTTAARNAFFAVTQTMAFGWTAGAVGPDGAPPWSPTWSLTVEWVFYLTTPLLAVLAVRRGMSLRAARWAAYVVAVLLFLAALPLPPVAFYLLPVANLGAMWVGAGLALTHRLEPVRRPDLAWSSFGGLMLIVLTVLPGITLGWSYRAISFPVAVASAALVIDGCWRRAAIGRLLCRFALPAIGLRAYSLYLWHMPLMWLVWVNLPGRSPWLVALVFLGLLPAVVALAFRTLEAAWLRPSDRSRACLPMRTGAEPVG